MQKYVSQVLSATEEVGLNIKTLASLGKDAKLEGNRTRKAKHRGYLNLDRMNLR